MADADQARRAGDAAAAAAAALAAPAPAAAAPEMPPGCVPDIDGKLRAWQCRAMNGRTSLVK
jgi:hypothetical protein